MTTVTITLSAEQSRALDRLIQSGAYLSTQDAVAAAVDMLTDDSPDRASLVARLTQAAREADEGDFEPEDGFAVIRRRFAEARSDG